MAFMDLSAAGLMALLALPTAWLLTLDQHGPIRRWPWALAGIWVLLSGYSLPLALLSLPTSTLLWLLWRRRLQRKALAHFIQRAGWEPCQAPTGFTSAYQTRQGLLVALGFRVGAGPPGKRIVQPIAGFQHPQGWPDGWRQAAARRSQLWPQRELPIQYEGTMLVFEALPQAEVLQARLDDLEASLQPGFDWAALGRRRSRWGWLWLAGGGVLLLGLSQWVGWQKLRVFPAEPALLLRSLTSLPRLERVLPAVGRPVVAVGAPAPVGAESQLAVSSPYQSIQLYTLEGKPQAGPEDSSGWTPAVFSEGDVVAVSSEGVVRRFPNTELGRQSGAPLTVAAAGPWVAVAGSALEVVTYADGGLQARMTFPVAPVLALACAGEVGVAGCEDGGLYRFELASGRPLAVFEQGGPAIRALAIVGPRIVTFSDAGCQAWSPDLAPGIRYSEAPATAGAADERVVCVGRPDGSIEIYPLEGGPARLRLVGHQAPIATLALSPDGKRLYSGANDTTVKIWRLD